ncbi:porin [Aeromonas veronii]|uniref:porin n=1 Tax=Aeromonas veronii TaxID=654 RepID=UPI000F5E2E8E|nr:porin [Aeromonas veronii]MCJ8212809.1 porin [Aeromonas veronii]RRA90874.1 porin [Aeromonas veronii bv. sobria]USP59756.1 porin [Aeromonas veronii]
MKKTILAIAIPALFASAANAAVIYDKDGTTFDVYGRVQADYKGEHDDKDATLVGTSRLGWSGKIALNNTWSGIAKTEWQVAAENSDNSKTRKVLDKNGDVVGTFEDDNGKFKARHIYAGFDGSQYGQVIFGQTDTAFYDSIAATDIFNEWGSRGNYYEGRQEGQVIYSNKVGGFTGKVSYQTSDDKFFVDTDAAGDIKELVITDVKRKNAYSAAVGYAFDFGLGVNAGYAYSDLEGKTAPADKGEKEDWALSANYSIAGFYFAGMYTEGEIKNKTNGAKVDGKGYEFAASYNVDAWTFLAGYNFAEARQTGGEYKDLVEDTLLGVQYAFTPKLKAYTEYKIEGLDNKDDQWTVALQYNF